MSESQIAFLSGLREIGDIRTMFAGEVGCQTCGIQWLCFASRSTLSSWRVHNRVVHSASLVTLIVTHTVGRNVQRACPARMLLFSSLCIAAARPPERVTLLLQGKHNRRQPWGGDGSHGHHSWAGPHNRKSLLNCADTSVRHLWEKAYDSLFSVCLSVSLFISLSLSLSLCLCLSLSVSLSLCLSLSLSPFLPPFPYTCLVLSLLFVLLILCGIAWVSVMFSCLSHLLSSLISIRVISFSLLLSSRDRWVLFHSSCSNVDFPFCWWHPLLSSFPRPPFLSPPENSLLCLTKTVNMYEDRTTKIYRDWLAKNLQWMAGRSGDPNRLRRWWSGEQNWRWSHAPEYPEPWVCIRQHGRDDVGSVPQN